MKRNCKPESGSPLLPVALGCGRQDLEGHLPLSHSSDGDTDSVSTMVVHDVEEIAGTQPPYGGGTMVVQRVSGPPDLPHACGVPSSVPAPILSSVLQTPEEERSLLHADSNGYTNLPDVVQPSHSPTENSKGQSPPSKDGGSDVSGLEQVHRVRTPQWQESWECWGTGVGRVGRAGHCELLSGDLRPGNKRLGATGWGLIWLPNNCPTPPPNSTSLVD